jgi:hypothetical protein
VREGGARFVLMALAMTLFMCLQTGSVSPVASQEGTEPVIWPIGHGRTAFRLSSEHEDGGLTVEGTVRVLNLPPSLALGAVRLSAERFRIVILPSDPNTLADLRSVSIRIIAPNGDCRHLDIGFDRCQITELRGGLVASRIGPGEIVIDAVLRQQGTYTVVCDVADESHAARSYVQIER